MSAVSKQQPGRLQYGHQRWYTYYSATSKLEDSMLRVNRTVSQKETEIGISITEYHQNQFALVNNTIIKVSLTTNTIENIARET